MSESALATTKPFNAMPSPRGKLLTGHMTAFGEDYLGFFERIFKEHGDRVRLRFMHQKSVFFSHPDDIAHILVKNHRNYAKQTRGYDAMRILVGNGLVTSEGDFWLRQRRITQPSFHRKRIEGFAQTMVEATAKVAERWETFADQGQTFDVADEMMKLTLEIVSQTLMSTNPADAATDVSASLDVALHYVIKRVLRPLMPPLYVPTPYNREVQRALDVLNGIVNGIIAARRESGETPPDLLSMWMEATDEETGEQMDDAQLRDEVMTMFLAGHETTATLMSWIWYLLDGHPEVEARLHAELDEVLGGRLPTIADLANMPYGRMIIDETMRLYPPVPVIARWSMGKDELGGFELPKDVFVFFSPYVTHRHPDFWPDPERFDPERFRDPKSDRARYAYFPFLGGPRQCIGNHFALMEGQLILSILASRYKVRRVDSGPVGLDVTVTLRPQGGLPVRLERR